MADATTAAKNRIDRALTLLERKILDLKARSLAPGAEEDLFAPMGGDPRAEDRIAVLEAAGRDASAALAHAADELRDILARTDTTKETQD